MRHHGYHDVPVYYPDNSKKQKKSKKQKHKSSKESDSKQKKSTGGKVDHEKEEEQKYLAKPRTVYPDDYEKSPSHRDEQS